MTRDIEGFDVCGDETIRFRITSECRRPGERGGEYFGCMAVDGIQWAFVLFDEEEAPVLISGVFIKVAETAIRWVKLHHLG